MTAPKKRKRPHRWNHPTDDRPTYLLALRRLHRQGWNDGRIADALRDLSARNIQLIERHRLWNEHDVEAALRPGDGEPGWTRQRVRYYRKALGLPARPQRHEGGSLAAARWLQAECRAASACGWGHLAPLTPAELRLVEDLAAGGPAPRAALEARTGLVLCPSRLGGRSPLRRLVDRQIVAVLTRRPKPVYGLAPGVRRHTRTPFKTSLERMAKRMGWVAKDA